MTTPTRSTLILRDRAVRLTIRHVHRGVFVVEGEGGEVLGASGNAEQTGRVVADALGVRPEEHGARSIAIEGHAVEGAMLRDEGVTGFRLRVSRSADTFTVGVGPLEATVARLLRDATPPPEDLGAAPPPLHLDERFAFAAFEQSQEPAALCLALSERLTVWLDACPDPGAAWMKAIEALRALGHDLWSWDDDGDAAIWSYDYVTKRPGAGLKITALYSTLAPAKVWVELESSSPLL